MTDVLSRHQNLFYVVLVLSIVCVESRIIYQCPVGTVDHHYPEEQRCCKSITCKPGEYAEICQKGYPDSTSCRPCELNSFQDMETNSEDAMQCRLMRTCSFNAGKAPVNPNDDDLTRDRRCRCLTEMNYYDKERIPGHAETCWYCGNQSNGNNVVNDHGNCVPCDGEVLYNIKGHVYCHIKDSIKNGKQTDTIGEQSRTTTNNPGYDQSKTSISIPGRVSEPLNGNTSEVNMTDDHNNTKTEPESWEAAVIVIPCVIATGVLVAVVVICVIKKRKKPLRIPDEHEDGESANHLMPIQPSNGHIPGNEVSSVEHPGTTLQTRGSPNSSSALSLDETSHTDGDGARPVMANQMNGAVPSNDYGAAEKPVTSLVRGGHPSIHRTESIRYQSLPNKDNNDNKAVADPTDYIGSPSSNGVDNVLDLEYHPSDQYEQPEQHAQWLNNASIGGTLSSNSTNDVLSHDASSSDGSEPQERSSQLQNNESISISLRTDSTQRDESSPGTIDTPYACDHNIRSYSTSSQNIPPDDTPQVRDKSSDATVVKVPHDDPIPSHHHDAPPSYSVLPLMDGLPGSESQSPANSASSPANSASYPANSASYPANGASPPNNNSSPSNVPSHENGTPSMPNGVPPQHSGNGDHDHKGQKQIFNGPVRESTIQQFNGGVQHIHTYNIISRQ